jgi:hypothetical protein
MVDVRIEDFEERGTTIYYKVAVRDGGAAWYVWRRYNAFHALHAVLQDTEPFPEKRFCRSPSFLETRFTRLDDWLTTIVDQCVKVHTRACAGDRVRQLAEQVGYQSPRPADDTDEVTASTVTPPSKSGSFIESATASSLQLVADFLTPKEEDSAEWQAKLQERRQAFHFLVRELNRVDDREYNRVKP